MQGVTCHHCAHGSSVNPFGYPPLSDSKFPGVQLAKARIKLEAEAARTHLRAVYTQFDEGLDGQINYDEFKMFVEETFGGLISGFSKKKFVRHWEGGSTFDRGVCFH